MPYKKKVGNCTHCFFCAIKNQWHPLDTWWVLLNFLMDLRNELSTCYNSNWSRSFVASNCGATSTREMPIQINHVNSGWIGTNPMSPLRMRHTLKVVGGITFAVVLCLSVMYLIVSSEVDISTSRRLEDLLPPGKEKEPGALFPLTTNDIMGFFFATLGLLVAAGMLNALIDNNVSFRAHGV